MKGVTFNQTENSEYEIGNGKSVPIGGKIQRKTSKYKKIQIYNSTEINLNRLLGLSQQRMPMTNEFQEILQQEMRVKLKQNTNSDNLLSRGTSLSEIKERARALGEYHGIKRQFGVASGSNWIWYSGFGLLSTVATAVFVKSGIPWGGPWALTVLRMISGKICGKRKSDKQTPDTVETGRTKPEPLALEEIPRRQMPQKQPMMERGPILIYTMPNAGYPGLELNNMWPQPMINQYDNRNAVGWHVQ